MKMPVTSGSSRGPRSRTGTAMEGASSSYVTEGPDSGAIRAMGSQCQRAASGRIQPGGGE